MSLVLTVWSDSFLARILHIKLMGIFCRINMINYLHLQTLNFLGVVKYQAFCQKNNQIGEQVIHIFRQGYNVLLFSADIESVFFWLSSHCQDLTPHTQQFIAISSLPTTRWKFSFGVCFICVFVRAFIIECIRYFSVQISSG